MPASLKRAIEILKEGGPKTLATKSAVYTLRFLLTPYCIIKINEMKKTRDLEKLVDFAANGCAGLISPFQDKQEILGLVKFVEKMKPKTFLEIGTASGGTLFLLARAAADNAEILSVDLPYGKFGGGYPNWKLPLYKSFVGPKQRIHLIREDSHSQKAVDSVRKALNGKKLDFIFIDGDHTYGGAKKDFELYKWFIKPKGIIGFHDIVVHTKESGCDVFRFWNEIKKKHKHKEIVHDWGKRMGGIGLLFM